ncbi:MAG: hypothetical protein M3Q63_00665 [bacterium]|nr:hypothetical protein [bacterium]
MPSHFQRHVLEVPEDRVEELVDEYIDKLKTQGHKPRKPSGYMKLAYK